FKLKWKFIVSGFLKGHILDHISTTLVWRHLIQPFFLPVQYPNTSWAVHLMSRKNQEIYIQFLNIDFNMLNSLCRINQNRDILGMRQFDDFFDRVNGS